MFVNVLNYIFDLSFSLQIKEMYLHKIIWLCALDESNNETYPLYRLGANQRNV